MLRLHLLCRMCSFPTQLTLSFTKLRDLAYGENPSTQAALYLNDQGQGASAATAMQLQGRPLSYNNVLDADAALELVKKFDASRMRHHQTQ